MDKRNHSTVEAPERRWVTTATEVRRCAESAAHGDYESRQEQMDPIPKPAPTQTGMAGTLDWLFAPRWTSCPKCDADKQQEADRIDSQVRGGITESERLKRASWQRAGIPKQFQGQRLSQWMPRYPQMKPVKGRLLDFEQDVVTDQAGGRSLVLSGKPGTGKTHAACAILASVVAQGGTARYATIADLVDDIASTYGSSEPGATRAAVAQFVDVNLSVVDEVGRDYGEHAVSCLMRVLDKRDHQLRSTVVCTNLNQVGLTEHIGEAAIDRLKRNGGKLLKFNWPSLRVDDHDLGDV